MGCEVRLGVGRGTERSRRGDGPDASRFPSRWYGLASLIGGLVGVLLFVNVPIAQAVQPPVPEGIQLHWDGTKRNIVVSRENGSQDYQPEIEAPAIHRGRWLLGYW
jgi:hypothetical protein